MAMSREAKALRKSADIFKKSVDPNAIVSKLFSEEMLTPEERSKATQGTDYQKLDEIFKSLERRVSISARDFHKLVKILKEIPALAPVGEQMMDFYRAEGQLRPVQNVTPSDHQYGDQMVVQQPVLPMIPAAMANWRYSCTHPQTPTPEERMALPSAFHSNISSVKPYAWDGPSGTTPVQDSEQDGPQSHVHIPGRPNLLSENFLKQIPSISGDAIRAGVTPDRSRQMEDAMRKFKDLEDEFENAKLHHFSEREHFEREISRLKRAHNRLEGVVQTEREHFDTTVSFLLQKMNELQLQNEKLQHMEVAVTEELKDTKLENVELKQKERAASEKCKALEQDIESLKKCKTNLDKSFDRVKRISHEMYDTTLQLDCVFQSVLKDERVQDRTFKEKVKELQEEVEQRKLSTWP